MIDLTQGEGNKRVRKRNKKPTKGQLAAQAAAEAYRASARLPGQGDGPRPAPYPAPSHAHSQSQIAEEGCGEDDDGHQASPMQTNFVTAINSPSEEQPHHHSLHRGSTTTTQQHSQPSGMPISSRQLHGHQNAAQPLPFSSLHNTLGLNPHIDPTPRPILSQDGPSHHPVGGPVVAMDHDILFSRSQPVSDTPQIQQQISGRRQQAQMILPPPPSLALAPSQPTYPHQLLSHQGKRPHASTSRGVSTSSHIPQRPQHSPLRQQQLQSDTPRQMQMMTSPQQPSAPTQPQLQHTRLPPMRTLSGSPAPTAPSVSLQQQPTPTLSTAQRQQPGPTTATTTTSGFARFASAHGSTGFGKPTFGKSALGRNLPNLMPTIRPLVLSEDKGKRRATESEGHGDSTGDDKREHEHEEGRGIGGSGGSRRYFVPPPPRPGIELVQRVDGGLITARRTSGRHDEGSVGWLNRFDPGEENQGDNSGALPPQDDTT